MISIRPERPADLNSIHTVHASAFPTDVEARLVDRLRAGGKALMSLVAESHGSVVGHILISPVSINAPSVTLCGAGLAPVAVLPDYQRLGIGTRLIRESIAACRREEHPFLVVLGEPRFYQRFGFRRASMRGLSNEYGVDEPFMLIELQSGSLPAEGGLVKYAPEFTELTA